MRIFAKILLFIILFAGAFFVGLLFYNSSASPDDVVNQEVTNFLNEKMSSYNIRSLWDWLIGIKNFVIGLFIK